MKSVVISVLFNGGIIRLSQEIKYKHSKALVLSDLSTVLEHAADYT